jgi:hypothetical protein
MNKRLKRVGALKAGVVLGVLCALFGLLLIPVILLAGTAGLATAREAGNDVPFASLFLGLGSLLIPVFYAVFGFVCGVIYAAIYNLVAKWTGGLDLTLEDAV